MIKYFLTMEPHVTNSLQQENAEISSLNLDSNLIYIFQKVGFLDTSKKLLVKQFNNFYERKQNGLLKRQ